MLNHDDDIGYPYCGQCHEDLVRCSDCRHFQANACTHPREQARFTPDLGAARSCPAFQSRYRERDDRLFTKLPAPVWLVSLLLFILLMLSATIVFLDPSYRYFRGTQLMVSLVPVPENPPVQLNQPLDVTLRIFNLMNVRSTPLFIEIKEQDLLAAQFVTATPNPVRITRVPGQLLRLEYAPIGPRAERPVKLTIVPTRPGVSDFAVSVYSQRSHKAIQVGTRIRATTGYQPVYTPEETPFLN